MLFKIDNYLRVLYRLSGYIAAVFLILVATFILTPLIYLGGVFYSVQLLPTFWQIVSGLNPIFYMVNSFRYGILGSSDVDVYWAFLILGAFIITLYTSCIWLLRNGRGIRT